MADWGLTSRDWSCKFNESGLEACADWDEDGGYHEGEWYCLRHVTFLRWADEHQNDPEG
jgi:hypothetical protein